MKKNIGFLIVLVAVAFLFYYLGKGSGGSPTEAPGRIVVAITDKAVAFTAADSILLKVSEVRLKSETRGWITISEDSRQFDLLRLKESGSLALLTDTTIAPDTYSQVRLAVDEVLVLRGGRTTAAKLPSGDLKILGTVTVTEGKTTSVVLDFLAGKSLHTAPNGKFIFLPVIKFVTRTDTVATVSEGSVTVEGGSVTNDLSVGMTEYGNVQENFVLDPETNLEIIGEAIHTIPKEEKEEAVQVTAKTAIERVIADKVLENALAVKLMTREGRKVWQVSGIKNAEVIQVYV